MNKLSDNVTSRAAHHSWKDNAPKTYLLGGVEKVFIEVSLCDIDIDIDKVQKNKMIWGWVEGGNETLNG